MLRRKEVDFAIHQRRKTALRTRGTTWVNQRKDVRKDKRMIKWGKEDYDKECTDAW